MSTPISQHFICPHCHTAQVLYDPGQTVMYVCGNCQSVLDPTPHGFVKSGDLPGRKTTEQQIPLGASGILRGKRYQVIAFAERHEVGTAFNWNEYTLRREEDGGAAYLSVYNGHWMLLDEIENDPLLNAWDTRDKTQLTYDDRLFEKFHDYRAVYNYFSGELHWKANLKAGPRCIEFIAPPLMIALEYDADVGVSAFYGPYVLRGEVSKAFRNGARLPRRTGIGAAQPFYFNLQADRFIIGALIFCLLALGIQYSYNSSRQYTPVFFDRIVIDSGTINVPRVSKSFTLPNRMSNMEVDMTSDVSNSWCEADLDLVNEKTGKEVDLAIGTEFYSGIDEGERWSEGGTHEKAFLCSVAPGQYHFVVTPYKEPTGPAVNIGLEVDWDVPSSWNAVLLCIVLALVTVGLYAGNYFFEQKRWE